MMSPFKRMKINKVTKITNYFKQTINGVFLRGENVQKEMYLDYTIEVITHE